LVRPYVQPWLYQVNASDPRALLAACAAILSVSFAAVAAPAWTARAISPSTALRHTG